MSSNAASPPAPGLDSTLFRTACGKFSTGITVVTVIDEDGQPYGMTANSFTSVSLDPPLVLICIDRKAAILPRLEAAKCIGINILAEDQKALSAQFARRGVNRFEAAGWFPGETGVPLLEGVLAYFECSMTAIFEGGDHRIFLAEVQHLKCFEGRPLLYFASEYHSLA
jgi:flavin reductase (DIM6/NTAB) family NADH-FMN oxidoreductase RutF